MALRRNEDGGESRVSTGIPGLDEMLHRGLIPRGFYLVRGGPGTGKSTLGLHFLASGSANGEAVLYVTTAEKEASVRRNAVKRGFPMDAVNFLDLTPTAAYFANEESYDVFSTAEVERGPITRRITEAVEHLKPTRVFVDSVTQFRYLSGDPYQFRKQMLSLASYLTEHDATVIFSSEAGTDTPDDDLQFMCDGVINLGSDAEQRTLSITKFRGSGFLGGLQPMRLGSAGMELFPRLAPESYSRDFVAWQKR